MNLIRVTSSKDEKVKDLIKLYEEAFPESERRDVGQLKWLIDNHPDMYFNAIENEGVIVGFFVYWSFSSFYYLEHLATYSHLRNMKIGQKVLDWISNNLKGVRLLEVERSCDEITIRRVAYYQRNGYKILFKNYQQPSYKVIGVSYPLWIMGNEEHENLKKNIATITEKAYHDVIRRWQDK